MRLSVLILAAGMGKRMKSDMPKVLQPLAGAPLLKHVIDTARQLEPAAIHVVYGHGGDRVQTALAQEPVKWVLQAQQLGTGHAVMQAMPDVPDDHLVLILYGDVPLTRAATLRQLVQAAGTGSMALLTVNMRTPAATAAYCATRRAGRRPSSSTAMRPRRSCPSARSTPA